MNKNNLKMAGHQHFADMTDFNTFYKTIYYVKDYIKVPLLNMMLENKDYMKYGKLNHDKIKSKMMELYEENISKFQ